MPKRRGRGRPKGSGVQKVKESANNGLDIFDNQSNEFEMDPDFDEVQADNGMPEERGDRNGNLNSYNFPPKIVEVGSGFKVSEDADTSMPKKRGPGRPKRSLVQNHKESFQGNFSNCNIPSNIVEDTFGCEESAEAEADVSMQKGQGPPRGSRVPNCQESADGNFDIYGILSDIMEEVSAESEEEPEAASEEEPEAASEEEPEAGNTPMKRGRGRPKGSTSQKSHRQNADDTFVTRKRKGRGSTRRALELEMKRRQSVDGKLDIIIHPTRLVPVGPGRKDFIADLSIIIRRHARLNVYRWRQVSKSTRDAIVQNVLNNWRLEDTDDIRRAILIEAGRLYRNWRNKLHDYYSTFETKEDALKNVPDDVNASDWPFLVDYFSSPSFESLSTINKTNRAKMRTNHTSGQKSFIAVSYDARDLVTGKEPDLQTLWQLTHKRANGEWVDEASKEVNDKVTEKIDEKLTQVEDPDEVIETIVPDIINSAFKTVVGRKSSYHPDFGAAVKSSCSDIVLQLQAEAEAQKREADYARNECNELRAKLVEVESQLNEERRKREEMEARLQSRQEEMQSINSQVQTAIQASLLQYLSPTPVKEANQGTKRAIAELQAQLNEAEDVIADLRSELGSSFTKKKRSELVKRGGR